MVLIGSDQDTHADLKRQRGSGLPALSILVAPNPDAIAASYILTVRTPLCLARLTSPPPPPPPSIIAHTEA